jgi:hypothetical protein
VPEHYNEDEPMEMELVDDDELTAEERHFVTQLESDKQWALDYYSGRKLEFSRMEKWYHKEHYDNAAEIGEGEFMDEATDDAAHQTIVNIPTNVINSVHGVLTDEEFYTQCISTSGRKSQEAASRVERFCHGTYWINRQVQGSDPWEDAALDTLIYGWGCVYSYWDPDRAAAMRRRKNKQRRSVDFWSYPIVVRRVHPADVYPLPFGVRERWRGCLWIVNRAVREIEEEWGIEIEPKPLYDEDGNHKIDDDGDLCYETYSPDDLVEYVDYWVWRRDDGEGNDDWTLWHCITANGQVIKRPCAMPEYEMLPYEVIFCRKSPTDRGSVMGMSFLYPIIEPVQEMELLANQQSRMIEMYVDPMLVIKGGTQENHDLEKGPGAVIEVDENGDAHYLTWNGSPPDVPNMMRFWRENAQDAFPPVMTGLQGGTSGLDTIALQQGGKMQTNKPRRNLELAIQRVNTKIISLLQQFSWDEAIEVVGQRTEADEQVPFGFSIKGKDTRGYENTIVNIRGRFPQEELRNVALAAQAVGAGLMSSREAAGKYMYTQDTERSFRMWYEENIIKDPTWIQFFFQMYSQLPGKSEVTRALEGEEETAMDQPGEMPFNPMDMMGAQAATALASDSTGVQRGVQRTPVESNMFSKIAGGGQWPK